MAAVLIESTGYVPVPEIESSNGTPTRLYVVPGPVAPTYWRRRLVAAVIACLAVYGVIHTTSAIAATFRDVPASVPERRPNQSVHVVQAGETLWSIAQALRPGGDIGALADRLSRANGGPDLQVGQRLIMP